MNQTYCTCGRPPMDGERVCPFCHRAYRPGLYACGSCGHLWCRARELGTPRFCPMCGRDTVTARGYGMQQAAEASPSVPEIGDLLQAVPEDRLCPDCHYPIKPGDPRCGFCGRQLR